MTDHEEQRAIDTGALLREANEHLVLVALRAQSDAEASALALEEVSRTIELDPLTKLPNRALMLDRFAQAIAIAKRHRKRLALLFLDMDNFKQINDTLGHAVGDQVLKRATQALVASVREGDTVSRHGGDEFLILLTEINDVSDATLVANKIVDALAFPSVEDAYALQLKGSIGISIYPDDGEDIELLIDLADTAMFRAKKVGGVCVAHGEEVVTDLDPSSRPVIAPQERGSESTLLSEPGDQNAQLREANEQLILAALNAQELLAAAEQANQRQMHFLAIAVHELRNPLTPLLYVAELLSRVKPEELPKLQSTIQRQVAHITRLVSDLVDVSRVNTGKLRLEPQLIDLKSVIEQAGDTVRPAMELRHQRLAIEMPSSVLTVTGDNVRLTQVFSNLLDNASKYTPDGGEVRLSVVPGEAITVMVSDNGIGIPADALPHVFEPFAQSAMATAFNGVGLGIGLTVVRELVLAHGGTVIAKSAGQGRGSMFVVTLPWSAHAPQTLAI